MKGDRNVSDIAALAGKVAGILSLAAFFPYVLAIIRGKTKPNRATWWIWFVVGSVLTASYYFSGARNTIWTPLGYGIGQIIVVSLAIKYGVGGWSRFDRFCLIGAGISLALWWIIGSPLVALSITLFINILGALPTIKKTFHEPESEDRVAWAIFFAGAIVNLFAVGKWTFAIACCPIYSFLACGTIAALVFRRSKNRK